MQQCQIKKGGLMYLYFLLVSFLLKYHEPQSSIAYY